MVNRAKKGRSFEKSVAEVQKMMGGHATVSLNEFLTDRLGHRREFDVVLRANVGGHEILGVIECKNLKKRVGTPEVDAFVTKSRDVRANITLLASKRGFTQPAIEKAQDYGIGLISLLPEDPQDCGFSVGCQWYVEVYKWSKIWLTIHFVSQTPPVDDTFDSFGVTWKGRPIIEWFQKELVTTYNLEENIGVMSLQVAFDKPRRLKVACRYCLVRGVTFHAERVYEKKSKWISFSGDGFYEFGKEGKGKIKIPPKGMIVGGIIDFEFEDWKPYEGKIPPSCGLLDWRIKVYFLSFDPKSKVVDLSSA